jgi:nicotinamidase-related amidase
MWPASTAQTAAMLISADAPLSSQGKPLRDRARQEWSLPRRCRHAVPRHLIWGLLLSGDLQQLGDFEWAMYKSRWGAFYRTRLEDHLRSLAVTTLAFAGCNFPNCPRTSIYEASERDFRVVLVEDAVSGVYDRGKGEMSNIGVSLMSAADVVAGISRLVD